VIGPDLAVWADGVEVVYRRLRHPTSSMKEYGIRLMTGRLRYDRLRALHGVSFRVRRGETLGVVGPNGAGKSTLLKVLARVIRPTAGRVVVRGRVAPMIELGAGFDGELTARENIVLYATLLGRPPAEVRRQVPAIADWAGLVEFLDDPIRSFSSGMLARLAFAVAADCEPDVLLIDEALAVGDEAFQVRSNERMAELLGRGSAVILVSHALPIVQHLADRVAWLDGGHLVALGHPATVVDAYRCQALELHDAPVVAVR
jgi:ABC-type polysaccharide/polyol phosphate transport system ATPase subunit